MLRRNVVRCCVVAMCNAVLCGGGEVRATAHRGSGGSVTWGATWAWEDLGGGGGGGATAPSTLTLITLHGKVGDSIDSHYRGLGKALGKSWKPDAVKALKTLSGFTPGARTIHLLEIPEEQIRFKIGTLVLVGRFTFKSSLGL